MLILFSILINYEEHFRVWEPPGECSYQYAANHTEKIYTFMVSKAATANNCRFFKWNIWMIGTVFKASL